MSEARPPQGLTVFLHVGTMKSGTSYLQSVLSRNYTRLERAGVLFPPWAQQLNAIREIRHEKAARPMWDGISRQLQSWPGRAAILSVEELSFASSSQAEQVVALMRPATVRVIITARDLARVLPSAWQTSIKNGAEWTLEEYVQDVQGSDRSEGAGRHFWRRHDLVNLVQTWSGAIGGQPIDLVTVPPSGSPAELLWERFCAVIELDPTAYDLSDVSNANPSLRTIEADLMRRVNAALPERVGRAQRVLIRKVFANELLRGSTDGESPVLPADHLPWLAQQAEQVLRELSACPFVVSGDLHDLVPTAAAPPTEGADQVGADGAAPSVRSDDEASALAVRLAGALMRELIGDPARSAGRPPRSARTGRLAAAVEADPELAAALRAERQKRKGKSPEAQAKPG